MQTKLFTKGEIHKCMQHSPYFLVWIKNSTKDEPDLEEAFQLLSKHARQDNIYRRSYSCL